MVLKNCCCSNAFRHRQGSRGSLNTTRCRGKEDAIYTLELRVWTGPTRVSPNPNLEQPRADICATWNF